MSKMYVVTLPRMISCVTAEDAAAVVAVVISAMQGGVETEYTLEHGINHLHVPLEKSDLPSVQYAEVEGEEPSDQVHEVKF